MLIEAARKALQGAFSSNVDRLNQAYGNSKNKSKSRAKKQKGSRSYKRSIPSGRNHTKGQETPSYKPQASVNQNTAPRGWNPTWTQTARSPSRGLGYKAYDTTTTANPYRNPNPTPKGTNLNINTRGGSALAKGLGGGVAIQAGSGGLLRKVLTKANPVVAAVLLFFDIVLADGGIEKSGSDAVEEWNRAVGETQTIKKGEPPAWYGGQNSNTFYQLDYQNAIISGGGLAGWGNAFANPSQGIVPPFQGVRLLISGVDYGVLEHWGFRSVGSDNPPPNGSSSRSYRPQVKDATGEWKDWFNTSARGVRILGFSPADGSTEPDPYAGVPNSSSDVKTASTTNHSNVKIQSRGTQATTPPSSRPPVPLLAPKKASDVIPTSVDNLGTKPNSPSFKPSKVDNPSPTPEPIPEPEPEPEKTIEEVEIEESTPEPQAEPNVISKTKAKRADGVIETTIVREATEDEMKEFKKQAATANKKLDDAREVIEKDRELGKLRRNIRPFGDETDYFYRTSKSDTDTDVVVEIIREPPNKIGDPPNAVPELGANSNKKPNTPIIVSEPPEPDEEDGKDRIPFIPPTPIKQAPADKCRGTCAGNNGLKLDGINALLSGTGVAQNEGILKIVKNTNDVINHKDYGLAKVQDFAKTAWKVTRADKVMAGVSMALTVHNAMMLSNNLLATVSEATNMSLNALGIRDEEDKEINLGASVKALIDKVLAGLIGDAKYEEITARIAKANRIYQAGINLLDTTYSLFDSARTVAELTGEYTGKIGNALREAGAVYEDAYEEFVEEINPQNTAMRRLGSIRDKIEVAENAFDSVAQISGSVVEVKETVGQIKEEKTELKAELDEFLREQKEEKDEEKERVQVTADISENDFDIATEEN